MKTVNPWQRSIVKYFYEHGLGVIKIDKKKLAETAQNWAPDEFKLPDWSYPGLLPPDEQFLQWLGLTTAINAHYKSPGNTEKFWAKWHGKKFEGAFAMTACVATALESGYPLLEAKYLAAITPQDMEAVFHRYSPMPLLEERRKIWMEVGNALSGKYGGRFENLFAASDWKCFNQGHGICERLMRDFPLSFGDSRKIFASYLVFGKKALLVPLMYYGRAATSGLLPQIKDPETLSPVADYELPKILHALGILTYPQDLERMITSRKVIAKGSLWEVELRTATVIAVTKLLEQINAIRRRSGLPDIYMPQLDFRLWWAGKTSKEPHHITVTTDY